MLIYEITSILKGSLPESKQVELTVLKDEWCPGDDGPRIAGTIKVEHTRDGLDEMFGEGYDVGDKMELAEVRFITSEQEEGQQRGEA